MLQSQVCLSRVTVARDFFPPILYFFPARRQAVDQCVCGGRRCVHDDDMRHFRPALILLLDTQDRGPAQTGVPQVERRRHRQSRYSRLARAVFWIQRWRFPASASSPVYR